MTSTAKNTVIIPKKTKAVINQEPADFDIILVGPRHTTDWIDDVHLIEINTAIRCMNQDQAKNQLQYNKIFIDMNRHSAVPIKILPEGLVVTILPIEDVPERI